MNWAMGEWRETLPVSVPLLIVLALHVVGVARLWHGAGVGRGASWWRVGCFAAGWLLTALALVSPLHELAEGLFSAHMIEHEILMVLVAPLLVVARPLGPMLWAMPATWRRPVALGARGGARLLGWQVLSRPFVAFLLHGAAIWLWHLPGPFETALGDQWLHWLEHLSFLGTALLFWWTVLEGRQAERYGVSIFLLFATAGHSGFLGLLIALSPRVIYPTQSDLVARFGLTPLLDQQLAGLAMWVPPGLVYAAAALSLAGLWISRSSRNSPRALPDMADAP